MKFEWEEIYNNEAKGTFWEATYRAKVPGGWIVRMENCSDFQEFEDNKHDKNRYIDEVGFQNVFNTMIFYPDLNHVWEIEDDY